MQDLIEGLLILSRYTNDYSFEEGNMSAYVELDEMLSEDINRLAQLNFYYDKEAECFFYLEEYETDGSDKTMLN